MTAARTKLTDEQKEWRRHQRKAEALNAAAEALLGQGNLPVVEQRAREALAISDTIGSKHDGGKRNDESKRFARARTAGFTRFHTTPLNAS